MNEPLLLITTLDDADLAREIGRELVRQRLAACVNVIPGATSIYLWEGELCEENEFLLLIKSHAECYEALEECLQDLHPYELPEIIAVPITHGLEAYLNWIEDCTQP